ncbi:MAG: DnaB-like helicase C-terminal domain-containing protein [Acidobacteriota bacterium]
MRKPWEVLDEEIFPYLSVERLFADLRALRRDGRLWQACCPIHADEEAAFSIDPERLEWNCFLGCGGGGPVQYLQKMRGLSWMDAARELALLAGVDPSILDPWQEGWTEEDFVLHEKLERRSSLLGVFMAYARSFFRSQAGQALRSYLINRQGFPARELEKLDLGLYTAPEDVWHYLRKTGRDLEEVRSWGLFETKWTGRIVGSWKDLRGRSINIWGWLPRAKSTGQGSFEACILFEQGDTLGGKSVPFNLDVAARLDKRDLLLLEGPMKALFTQSLGLEDTFPVAAGGDLNSAQIAAIQNHLRFGGKLTLCWDYDPDTDGTRKDRTLMTLQRLKKANFPIYVVDSALMADHDRPKQEVTVSDFILRHGGGKKGLKAFQELLEKREAQIVVQGTDSENESWNWPGVFDIFHSFSLQNSRSYAKTARGEIAFGSLQVLEPFFRAAEEIGRRIAKGFLRALPKGLAHGLTVEGSNTPELASHSAGELPRLSAQILTPPTFSVDRLEEQTRAAARVKLSGWRAVDNLEVRFNSGELAVLVGRTGHGKTSVLVGLLLQWLNQATEEGTNKLFLFYSMEEPEVRIYHRLLSLLTARDGEGWTIHEIQDYFREQEVRGPEQGCPDLQTLGAARERLRYWEESLQIICQPGWSIGEMETHAKNSAESQQISAIFVDHLQRVSPGSGQRRPRGLRACVVARRLKALAVKLSCPIVTAAAIGLRAVQRAPQIPRDKPFVNKEVQEVIRMRRPQLQQLREVGIEQEADLVLGLLNYAADYRAEVEEPGPIPATTPFEVGTLKNRYGPAGCWASLLFEGCFGFLRDPMSSRSQKPGVRIQEREFGIQKTLSES